MKFSNILHDFKHRSPAELHLIDLAYLAVLPPLLLMIKLPMLLFLVAVLGMLLITKKGAASTLIFIALLGVVAILLSLYGAFNFAGLSRLKLFVELMIYMLLLAVSLQRLTRNVNSYLRISPVLLLALSLFFYHSIGMLVYVVVEVFLLLWLILTYRMRTDFLSSVRTTGMLFAMSLPWVVLLFIFFPRISFEHASYGFKGDEIRRTGHDGTMRMDAAALLVPSERIVMEVGFLGAIPAENKLYFRGSVLYVDKIDHWEPLPPTVKRRFTPAKNVARGMVQARDDIVAYKVSLYPTYKPWLYLLDMPLAVPDGAKIDSDFEVKLDGIVDVPQHYDAGSALRYRYGKHTAPAVLRYALDVNPSANPRTAVAAQALAARYGNPVKRTEAVWQYFRDANLTYTLRPEPLDLNRSADDFLFHKREGYCVHFAGTFVTMLRLAGIPARIVTGYKADHTNSVNNYLAVKEKDAHAWVEAYVANGWHRLDPTSTASFIDDNAQRLRNTQTLENENTPLSRINLYLLYSKYQVETWILQYSHFRQMQLLDRVKNDPVFVAKFVGSLLVVIALSAAGFFWLRRPRCQVKIICRLRPVLKKLHNRGYVRHEGETLHQLFGRYITDYPQATSLQRIDTLYHQDRYGSHDTLHALKRAIADFMQDPSYEKRP